MDHSQHSIHTNDSPHSGHDHHAMMHGTEATMTATVYPYDQQDHSQHHAGMDHRAHDMTTMEHMMSMAFHFGCNETILFSWWKTETVLGLIGSMAVIFIMAVLYEGLKYYREFLFWKTYNLLEYRPVSGPQRNPEDPQRSMPSSSASPVQYVGEVIHKQPPTMMSVNHLIQTVLHIIQVTLSFLLMLIFMTYNVWLCIAVVLGAAVGYFLFCWKKSVIVDVTEHCH